METTELLTVQQVADRLGVSHMTVRRWIRNGELEAIKLGARPQAHVRIPPVALLRFARVREAALTKETR